MNPFSFMTIDYFSHFNKLCILSQLTTTTTTSDSNSSNIYEIIKNPAWTPIGVILTAIAIIVAVLISRSQSQRKDFSYYIISSESILSIADDLKNRMAISFDNKPIKNMNLIVIRFKNTGNIPIQASDYERNIWIKFGEFSEVLSVDVVSKEPDNLNVIVKNNPLNQSTANPLPICDVISINPLLLNSGESFDLKILITEFKEINIDARVVGIRKIRKNDLSDKNTGVMTKISYLMLLFALSPVLVIFSLAIILTGIQSYNLVAIVIAPFYFVATILIYINGINFILDIKLIDIFKKKIFP
jgi:hypothetical protein